MNLIDRAAALLALKTLVTELVDDETKEFRLSVCEGCDRFDHEHRRCKVCKCYVDAKVQSKENYNPIKLRHEITYCPKGRWNDKELADFYNKIDGGDADTL
jgi:hypothetical protein